jgi:hypothetical protein
LIKNTCFLTNHRRRKKKEGEDDEYMSHLVPYKWFRRTRNITSIGLKYNVWGIYDIVVFFDVIN